MVNIYPIHSLQSCIKQLTRTAKCIRCSRQPSLDAGIIHKKIAAQQSVSTHTGRNRNVAVAKSQRAVAKSQLQGTANRDCGSPAVPWFLTPDLWIKWSSVDWLVDRFILRKICVFFSVMKKTQKFAYFGHDFNTLLASRCRNFVVEVVSQVQMRIPDNFSTLLMLKCCEPNNDCERSVGHPPKGNKIIKKNYRFQMSWSHFPNMNSERPIDFHKVQWENARILNTSSTVARITYYTRIVHHTCSQLCQYYYTGADNQRNDNLSVFFWDFA